jgi:hypothetical protein
MKNDLFPGGDFTMSKRILGLTGAVVLALSTAGAVLAQDTQKTTTTTTTTVRQTVQNPDGTYTVVEYPVDKEVQVKLLPSTVAPSATGTATVLRSANSTTIKLNLNGLPADVSNLNLYAIDPTGAVTMVGPVSVSNGVATYSTTTPMNKFMLVLSPEANLTALAPETKVLFRSDVPQGLSVIPIARSGEGPGAPVGEKVAAAAAPSYSVPMLNIPSYPMKKESEVHVNFANSAALKRATFFITPNFNDKGATRVKAKFHELSDVPKGQFLTLWAVGPDGTFTRLGSTSTSAGSPNVATIDTDTNNTNVAMADFGLFMTVEPNETVTSPTGPVVIRIAK